jgi:hypothetical protein
MEQTVNFEGLGSWQAYKQLETSKGKVIGKHKSHAGRNNCPGDKHETKQGHQSRMSQISARNAHKHPGSKQVNKQQLHSGDNTR